MCSSDLANEPWAARTMSPPLRFCTGEFTVRGLAVRITIFPPVLTVRPFVLPMVPIVSEPVFAMKIPPVVVSAAIVMPAVDVVTGAARVPTPVDAVS